MNLSIYTIFDSAAGAYMRPFFLQSDGQAIRMFTDVATDPKHEVGRHPEDYSLCSIGIFNDANAQLIDQKVTTLITGNEAVAKARNTRGHPLSQLNLMQQQEQLNRDNGHNLDAEEL